MTKTEFLSELNRRLEGFPKEDVDDRLMFYSEAIDDRIEDGLSEEEAVNDIGSTDEIVSQIISQIPLKKIVKERAKKRKALNAGVIVLLVLGFPVWGSILISLIAVAFSLYIVLWALVICVYAVNISLAAGAVFAVIEIFVYLFSGNAGAALFFAGAALVCTGGAILMFFVSKLVTKSVIKFTGWIILKIKSLFVKKGVEENDNG